MVSFIPTRQWAARGPPPTTRSLLTPLVSVYFPEMVPPTASFQERSQMELGIVADFSARASLSHVSFQKENPLCLLPVLTCADLIRHHKCPSPSGEKGQGWLVYRECSLWSSEEATETAHLSVCCGQGLLHGQSQANLLRTSRPLCLYLGT